MAKWQKIPREEAEQHRLYGVGGWLVLLSISVLLGSIPMLFVIVLVAIEPSVLISDFLANDHPVAVFTKILFALSILFPVVFFWLLFTKHSGFRPFVTRVMIVFWPIVAATILAVSTIYNSGPDSESINILIEGTIQWIIQCVIWVTYLQRSRRVRVTFEHSIRSDEEREVLDEAIWSKALAEFDGGSLQSGLWAKSLAHAVGDESTAKAYYLKQRAIQIQQKDDARGSNPGCFAQLESMITYLLVLILLFFILVVIFSM